MFVCLVSTSLLIWVWSPRLSHLCGLLLRTSSTPVYLAVIGLWVVGYISLCHCEFMDWLLQHCSCWCTEVSDGQVTACVECCCTHCHQHSDVLPRPSVQTVSAVYLKRICSLDTSAFSSLEVLDNNCAIEIRLLTYSLTILVSNAGELLNWHFWQITRKHFEIDA